MSDEDIIVPGGGGDWRGAPDEDFEEMLEALIVLAQGEGRDFLAYLLRMALIEARNRAPENTGLPH
jgi:hypothetical protein